MLRFFQQTDLMKCLGLTSYAPSQLSIQDAMRMMSSKEGESLSETDLPGLLLYHLMKNNYRWRDKVQQHITNAGEGRKEEHSNLASGHQANKLFDNDFESFLNEVELCSESFSTPVIHPSDILLNTIMCCNLELKQILFQKLLMCKQSVPLIYRIPSHDKPCYSIFPLRSMSMECRTKIGATLLCAATMKSKVVGFIRVGNSRYSKSKLLNNILSEQKHATFCHRDDVDVNTKPLNAKGLIEAAWFLPSRKPSDPFEEVITFLNLRGDAAGLPNEIAITGIITSAVVTLIDISCLEHEDTIVAISDLCKCSAHIIVLLTNSYGGISAEKFKSILRHCFPNPREKVKFVQTFSWNTNNLKPEVTLRKELLSAIKLAIQEKEGSSLSEYGKALFQNKQVILDETTNDHVEAKSAAKFIFAGLCSLDEAKLFLQTDNDDIPKVTSKEEHLPLQGDLWKKWSELKKTQHKNKGGNDIYELQGSIQNNMDDIRKKQGQKCSQLKQSMSRFIENLIKANARKNGYPNFLLWLKLILNENSRNVLPGLLTELCQLWLKVTEAKETNASDKEIKLFQDAAEEAEIKLAKASFGLEHFMRELGQVYESADESPLPPKQPISDNIPKQKLPSVMADLLLEGQAFEIMDGDAANIAISWVTEVLKHLKAKIGNKTLFIVSVLGIQSSGKSTLLNALFGLQFTVSAGRCTRGVFGQLAPVDKKNNLPYDYILVVDTEGLRAPELGQMHLDHDNELATFVIGIGDVTLINIKGENTAEMKDVLQIAVQAFLRMKLANDKMELKRKCIFIHQNVGAVNAEEQMMQGLKKFQETLDMMTKNAAEEENMRHIQSFSQVIDFQGEKHVLYFPDLWYGDPPMAPCNPGYSIKVMEVLRRLEQIAKSGCALTTIDGLIHRIEDLWNGIMAENFVFSFRNTLEIKTYNSMESKYQELSSEYYSYLMEWFENTATIEIDLCKSEEDLQKRCEDLKHTLPMNFVQRKEKIEKKLLDYFDNHDLAYILIQWKNLRLLKFQAMAESVERHTLDYIEQKKEERRIDILSTGTDRKLEKEINAKAKDLAETYRGQEVEKWKLESTFDKVWIDWTKEFIQTKHCDTSTGQIESMLIKILHQLLPQNITLVLQEISDTEMKQRLKKLEIPHLENSWTQRDINVEHIDKKPPSGFFKEALTKAKDFLVGKNKPSLDKEDILDAIEYTNNVFRKMDVEFVDLLQKDVQIRPEHATDIIKKTIDCFDSENNKPDHKLTFQTPYKVKLVVYICSFAFSKFKFMAGRYEKKHGVKGKLAAYKETAKHLFLNTVQKKSYEFVAADFFCDRVKERVIATIENAIPRQIVEDIMRHFSYDKYHVMLSVMEDLGRKNHFPSFISYVKDSKSFVHSWMDTFIKKTIFETTGASDSRYIELAKSRLAKIMKCIKEAIVIATEHTISKGGNWAKSFESRVKTELAVPSEFLDPVTRKIKDLKDFKEKLLEKQADLENAVIEEFHSCDPNGKVWKGTSPIETVMKEIWGCPEQCPFCSEPCQRNEGHLSDKVSHSCIQHRPLCVRGTTWKTINTLDIEPCNFKVQSDNLFDCGACKLKCRESGKCTMSGDERVYHPFKEYNTYLPDWDIAPNPTMDVSKYWMWFVVKFIKELCAQYRAAETDIPESWKAIRDKDAIDSLRLAVN